MSEDTASRPRSGVLGDTTMMFMHLPKTGGTTLKRMITAHPSLSAVAVRGRNLMAGLEQDPNHLLDLAARHDVIMGHMAIEEAAFDPLAGRIVIVSLLRHPIERAVSHYKHARRTPQHGLYDELQTKSFDEAWRTIRRFRTHIKSNQTRAFANARSLAAFDALAAKHRIMLGRQDRFEAFVQHLERTFAITLPRVAPANVAPASDPDPDISATVMAELEAANATDFALYARIDPVWDSAAV